MNSTAFRKFKAEMGQANHFLITILVGLDSIEDGARKRETFHTSWNPQNIKASASRSRQYAIKSALAWAVDNLDMYLRLCNRLPRLYSAEESSEIAQTKHSVYKKLKCISKFHPQISTSKLAYVDLLICWRNTMVHFDAENEMMSNSQNYFLNIQPDDPIVTQYHLDIGKMINRFSHHECPTFKDIATLISMTIHFVEDLDHILLQEVDQRAYLESQLFCLLRSNEANENVFREINTSAEKNKKELSSFLFLVEFLKIFILKMESHLFWRSPN